MRLTPHGAAAGSKAHRPHLCPGTGTGLAGLSHSFPVGTAQVSWAAEVTSAAVRSGDPLPWKAERGRGHCAGLWEVWSGG